MCLEILGRILFHRPTNLTDQDNTLSTRIGKQYFDNIDMLSTGERITADTDSEGLSQASKCSLTVLSQQPTLADSPRSGSLDRFVRQSAHLGQHLALCLWDLSATHVPDRETTPVSKSAQACAAYGNVLPILPCLKI